MSIAVPDFCLSCARGFYNECGHDPKPQTVKEAIEEEAATIQQRHRSLKRDDAVKDQQSTGRKRAARLYPLDRAADCEWHDASESNPKGGGDKPIITPCLRQQQARHHGPDKNTLNNDPGNVSRICHAHHNKWHAANDADYDPNRPLKD